MTPPSDDPVEDLYRSYYQAIFKYVLRRTGADPETVADLVAEVFLVALRRQDAIPPPPEDRLWLYGVARKVVQTDRRGRARRFRLNSRLQAEAEIAAGSGDSESLRLVVLGAIERLRPADREALRLVSWDGLSHAEAAQVLGCSVNAVALRIHRAKTRLRAELSAAGLPADEAELERPAPTLVSRSRSQQ